MIDLYYWPTPNGHKITIFLEEVGLDYRIRPVDIGKGDQFKPEFLAISPNNRMPAIVDHAPADGGEPVSIFESGAIQSGVVVAVIVPTAPMAGVGKPGRLVFGHRRGAPTCVGVAHV